MTPRMVITHVETTLATTPDDKMLDTIHAALAEHTLLPQEHLVDCGYTVIFVPFENGEPAGEPVDVLTGFLSEDGNALGRPVGVALEITRLLT
jgi:hypothetical protein